MAVFSIQLLIAVCLCVNSCLCYGELNCTEESPHRVTVFVTPRLNKVNCSRPFHGVGANYTWTWFKQNRHTFYPISQNPNVTTTDGGAVLIINRMVHNELFMCEIRKPNNQPTGPIEFDVVQAQAVQFNAGDFERTRFAWEYDSIYFGCSAKGYFVVDDIKFNWYRAGDGNDTLIENTNRIYVDTRGYIYFTPILKSDTFLDGHIFHYYCVVTSSKIATRIVGSNIYIQVEDELPDRILTKPILLYATPNLAARINDSIVLECVFSTDFPNGPVYKWYQPVPEDSVVRQQRVHAFKQRLFIDSVQPHHKGNWHCAALDSALHRIRVYVTC